MESLELSLLVILALDLVVAVVRRFEDRRDSRAHMAELRRQHEERIGFDWNTHLDRERRGSR